MTEAATTGTKVKIERRGKREQQKQLGGNKNYGWMTSIGQRGNCQQPTGGTTVPGLTVEHCQPWILNTLKITLIGRQGRKKAVFHWQQRQSKVTALLTPHASYGVYSQAHFVINRVGHNRGSFISPTTSGSVAQPVLTAPLSVATVLSTSVCCSGRCHNKLYTPLDN